MRSYKDVVVPETTQKEIDKILCNWCGDEIDYRDYKDYLHVKKLWGYGSRKDMCTDEFDICEDCYDIIVKSFKIPITEVEDW